MCYYTDHGVPHRSNKRNCCGPGWPTWSIPNTLACSVRELGYTHKCLEQCRNDKRRPTLALHITQHPFRTHPSRSLHPHVGLQTHQLCRVQSAQTQFDQHEHAPSRETPARSVLLPSGRAPRLSRSFMMACSRACSAVSWRRVSHSSRVNRLTSRSRSRSRLRRSPFGDDNEPP